MIDNFFCSSFWELHCVILLCLMDNIVVWVSFFSVKKMAYRQIKCYNKVSDSWEMCLLFIEINEFFSVSVRRTRFIKKSDPWIETLRIMEFFNKRGRKSQVTILRQWQMKEHILRNLQIGCCVYNAGVKCGSGRRYGLGTCSLPDRGLYLLDEKNARLMSSLGVTLLDLHC